MAMASRQQAAARAALCRIPSGVLLVAMLALANPIGEATYNIFGTTNLLGAPNLNASWPGLAVAFGGIVTAAGAPLRIACAALVLSGIAIGSAKTTGSHVDRSGFAGAAHAIEQQWHPGDVVVDGTALTPVPLTGLDVYLPRPIRNSGSGFQ